MNKKTMDAVKILHKRYIAGDPEREHELCQVRIEDALERKKYEEEDEDQHTPQGFDLGARGGGAINVSRPS